MPKKTLSCNNYTPSPKAWDKIKEGLWSIEPASQKLLYCNLAAEKICDRTLKDFLKNSNLWQEIIHPDDHFLWDKFLQNIIKNGEAETHYRIVKQSGETCLVKNQGWSLVNSQGNVEKIEGFLTEANIENQIKNDNQFQNIISNLPGVIYQYILHPDGSDEFTYVSPVCQEIYEITPEIACRNSKLMWSFIHPDDLLEFQSSINRSLNTLTKWRHQWRNVSPSGKIKWLSGIGMPDKQENGDVIWNGSIFDITDRVVAENQVKESEQLFRATFEQASVGISQRDLDGNFIKVNRKLCDILGYEPEELLGHSYRTINHPEDVDIDAENLAKLSQGQINTYSIDKRYIHKNGTIIWVNLTLSLIGYDRLDSLSLELNKVQYYIVVVQDISDRKKAEIALQESQRLYQVLAEASPVGIFRSDAIGNIIYVNDRCCEITGKNSSEIINQGWFNSIYQDDRKRIIEGIKQTLATQQPSKLEYRLIGNNGIITWVIGQTLPEINESGEVISYVGTITDISDLKEVEIELQQTKKFLESVLENLPVAVIIKEAVGLHFTFWNPTAQQLLGYSSVDVLGKTDYDLFSKEEADFFTMKDREVLDSGQILDIAEEVIETQSGKIKILHTKKTAILDQQGEPLYLLVICEDITEQKQAEIALKQSEAESRQLAERAELLNHLSNQIRNSLNVDTIIENTVQSVRKLLKIDRVSLMWYRDHLDTPAWEVVKEDKLENIESVLGFYTPDRVGPLEAYLRQGKSVRIDWVHQLEEPRLKKLLLAQNYTSLLCIPFPTQSGKIGALILGHTSRERPWIDSEVELMESVGVQLSIGINQAELYNQAQESARIATEKSEELEETMRELKQTQSSLIQAEKMSSLGQMVAGVAHEINNPVNFIYGNITPAQEYIADLLRLIELYQETYPASTPEITETTEEIELDYIADDLPKLLKSIKFGAERIKDIVKSLRVFSRLDEAEMKEVDLHENIDSTLMILQNRIKEKPERPAVQIIKNYGKLPLVECYAGQLNQVFMNLLSNALDALDDKDQDKTYEEISQSPHKIYISTTIIGRKTEIRIRDNGTGMKPAVIDRIFDPFFTTKPIGKGTGLGLSISYQIVVEKHKGSMRCLSEIGQGTEFIIEIPLRQLD